MLVMFSVIGCSTMGKVVKDDDIVESITSGVAAAAEVCAAALVAAGAVVAAALVAAGGAEDGAGVLLLQPANAVSTRRNARHNAGILVFFMKKHPP